MPSTPGTTGATLAGRSADASMQHFACVSLRPTKNYMHF